MLTEIMKKKKSMRYFLWLNFFLNADQMKLLLRQIAVIFWKDTLLLVTIWKLLFESNFKWNKISYYFFVVCFEILIISETGTSSLFYSELFALFPS